MLRFPGRSPVRRNRFRIRALLLAGVLATLPLAAFGSGTLSPSPASARADTDSGDSLVLNGPKGSGVSLSVTPKDLSTVHQGDTVHLHFSGLKKTFESVVVGTCSADLPLAQIDFDDFQGVATQQACLGRIPTGLTGDLNPTSADNPGLSTSVYAANPRQDGTLDVDYLVGSGDAVNNPAYTLFLKDGTQKNVKSLTCDTTHACTIGFEVELADAPYEWHDLSTLSFKPAAGSADATGCSGLSKSSTVSAAGPERMQDPVAAMNGGYCSTTKSPIPVSYVPSGGGESDPGGVSAVGSGTDLAFAGSPYLAKHPLKTGQVAVPIGLNAVELAQWGGESQRSVDSSQLAYNDNPIDGLALDPADVARIVLHDYPQDYPADLPTTLAGGEKDNPLAATLLSRKGNKALLAGMDPSLVGLPMLNAPTVTYALGEDSGAIALSSYLAGKSPAAWTFPKNDENDAAKRSGKAVGAIEEWDSIVDHGQNGSSLTSETSSTSGLYNAKYSKDITGGGTDTWACPSFSLSGSALTLALTKACVRFGVMDAGTAAALDFTGTRLAAGDSYVAPGAASLQAAAAGTLNADGYFDTSSSSAYPLTYVEYAVVPTAPLLTSSCKPRTGQQDMLKNFLTYAVGDGQARLPAGLAPIGTDLAGQAKTAIGRIGTGKATGTCGPAKTGSGGGGGGTSTTSGGSSDGSGGGSIPTGEGPSTGASSSNGGKAGAANPAVALPKTEPVSSTIPAFGGMAKASSASVLIGLLLLTGLVSAAAVGVANGVGPAEVLRRARRLVFRRSA